MPGGVLRRPIERKVHAHSTEVPVKFSSVEELLAQNTAAPRFRTLLVRLFAAIDPASALHQG